MYWSLYSQTFRHVRSLVSSGMDGIMLKFIITVTVDFFPTQVSSYANLWSEFLQFNIKHKYDTLIVQMSSVFNISNTLLNMLI